MPYSREFFDLQFRFAEKVALKLSLPLEETLYTYTTFTKSFGDGEEWRDYMTGLRTANDPIEWTYNFYLPRSGSDLTSHDTTFHGHTLFGCFYYVIRDGGIIRPHLIKNDHSGRGVLNKERMPARQQELRAMFAHIRANVPEANTVLGNSWMYNLEAYRRLYPPQYTKTMPESDLDEFQFLARWGQFFDREWRVKESLADVLFARLDALEQLENLRYCFPYPILRPRYPIDCFYDFYGLS